MIKKDEKYEPGGMAFVGFILLGLAAGFLTGQFVAGILGGIGLGFVAMGILSRGR